MKLCRRCKNPIGYDTTRQNCFTCVFAWLRKRGRTMLVFLTFAIFTPYNMYAGEITYYKTLNIEKLADAIGKAENSKSHPYGIMVKYKQTTPRQACINTIKSALKRWNGQGEFIPFLAKTYAPIGASNDPTNLNKNWIKNVSHFYNKSINDR